MTPEEEKILEIIRNLDWGKVEIAVKEGKPVMLSIKKDIKFDGNLTNNKINVRFITAH